VALSTPSDYGAEVEALRDGVRTPDLARTAGRLFARVHFRFVAPEMLADPARAAATRPVFELRTKADSDVAAA